MGFNVTFHPVSVADLQRYVFDVAEKRRLAPARAAEIARTKRKQADLVDGILSRLQGFVEEVRAGESFGSTLAFASGAVAGYLHPFWYGGGGALSLLVPRHGEIGRFFKPLPEVARGAVALLTDDSGGLLSANYTASGVVPPESVPALGEAIEALATMRRSKPGPIFRVFDEEGLDALRRAIAYARENGLGLMEATDLVVPLTEETCTDAENLRAHFLGNMEAKPRKMAKKSSAKKESVKKSSAKKTSAKKESAPLQLIELELPSTDTTFHPVDPADLERFVFAVAAQKSLAKERAAEITKDADGRRFLREGVMKQLQPLVAEVRSGESFAATIGLACAAVAGFRHPFWYAERGAIAELAALDPEVAGCFTPLPAIARGPVGKLKDPSAGLLPGQNTASGIVLPKDLGRLESALRRHGKPRRGGPLVLGQKPRDSLLRAIAYAKERGLGLMEASGLVAVAEDAVSTDVSNMRAHFLGNIERTEPGFPPGVEEHLHHAGCDGCSDHPPAPRKKRAKKR